MRSTTTPPPAPAQVPTTAAERYLGIPTLIDAETVEKPIELPSSVTTGLLDNGEGVATQLYLYITDSCWYRDNAPQGERAIRGPGIYICARDTEARLRTVMRVELMDGVRDHTDPKTWRLITDILAAAEKTSTQV